MVACQANNLSNATATHIRSYVNKEVGDSFTNWSIWEAARATSAAPTFFPSISVNGVEYIDGGMGFNNPVILCVVEFIEPIRSFTLISLIGCIAKPGSSSGALDP